MADGTRIRSFEDSIRKIDRGATSTTSTNQLDPQRFHWSDQAVHGQFKSENGRARTTDGGLRKITEEKIENFQAFTEERFKELTSIIRNGARREDSPDFMTKGPRFQGDERRFSTANSSGGNRERVASMDHDSQGRYSISPPKIGFPPFRR